MKYGRGFLFHLFSLLLTYSCALSYEVPPATVEPLRPAGLRVSIPDEEGITLFAFHGNVNLDFENGLEAGQIAVDVLRKKNGRWTYTNREVRLKEGDVVYYWLHVIKSGLGYNRLFQSHKVTEFFTETGQSAGPDPVTPAPPRPSDPVTSRPVVVPPPECKRTATTVNGVAQCSGKLVFDTHFSAHSNALDYWTRNVHFNDDESQFVVFLNDPKYSNVTSGVLSITPSLLDNEYGEGFALRGPLDLKSRCTSSEDLCTAEANGQNILPPVISARLTTERTFSFRYGTVEMKAKLPRGDWVVPELWLLPKVLRYGKANSGKIILANSFGNRLLVHKGDDIGNTLFKAGLQVGEKDKAFTNLRTSGGLWSDDFHIFKLVWRENEIKFFLDNKEIGTWNGDEVLLPEKKDTLSPFDHEFYFSLGIHVGGDADFPDGSLNSGREKPWRNTQVKRKLLFYEDSNNWYPTWNDQTKLQVEYIKVWAI